MTSPVTVARLIDALYSRVGDFTALPSLLGLVAEELDADAIRLGLDLGYGYHHDSFVGNASTVALHDTPASHTAPGLPAGWIEQRSLPVGTAGRRLVPRSDIAVLRSPDQPAFRAKERNHLTRLLPHLNRVLTLTHELETRRQREIDAYAALEHTDQGILLVAPDGRILHSNARARELLSQCETRIFSHLLLRDRELQARYESMLVQASLPDAPEALDLLLPATPPVLLRLHANHHLDRPNSPFTLTLTSRNEASTELPAVVGTHFGLTPGEFRLSQCLLSGMSLKQCAQAWDRSYDTLRGHLKSLLAKTGTHRQTELVTLLGTFLQR